jgi:hypothetical protein
MSKLHDYLCSIEQYLDTDYAPYGKDDRNDGEFGPDCSNGCKFALWLEAMPCDWLVCCNPESPRFRMLTCEHTAGRCFEYDKGLDEPDFKAPEPYVPLWLRD